LISSQRHRVAALLPAAIIGGAAGGMVLLLSPESAFRALVPYLILLAAALLALQSPLKRWLERRHATRTRPLLFATLPIAAASFYGGYFGAGMSVIVLAVLAIVIDENLTKLNALKQLIGLCGNTAAAVYFVFSERVLWSVAGVMAIAALLGGVLGGRLAAWIAPQTLRSVIVGLAILLGIFYLFE
jgi:uncharacterized membrane protein YfcA